MTPMDDPRQFQEVITDWLVAQPRPAYKSAPLLGVSPATLTRWRTGYPCHSETAVRSLMTLIDELDGDEEAISRTLGEGIPFRPMLRAWLDKRGLSCMKAGKLLDMPHETVRRWLSTRDCELARAMRARMHMIDEGRA